VVARIERILTEYGERYRAPRRSTLVHRIVAIDSMPDGIAIVDSAVDQQFVGSFGKNTSAGIEFN
jgi:hypothetical protein